MRATGGLNHVWCQLIRTYKGRTRFYKYDYNAYICVWLTDETWVGVYTLKDCYPVHETYTKNSSVTTTTRFFDLEPGISDPEVFTPPATCMSALPERMASDC